MSPEYVDGRRGGGRKKIEHCRRCGAYHPRGVGLSRAKLCPRCGAMGQAKWMSELHSKQGDSYEKWKRRTEAWAKQLARGGA